VANSQNDWLTEIFEQADPLEGLRTLAIRLNEQGYEKEYIYNYFLRMHAIFEERQNTREADLLFDMMDMITGWYSGKNFHLK